MSGPEIITLGCRLNAAEGEAIRALAAGRDDLVIVNSCAVTNEAVRQARQAIRRARRARPDAEIVVTGCAAQVEPETFAAMPEVSRVLGNREKFDRFNYTKPVRAEPVEALPFPILSIERKALRQAQGERGWGLDASSTDIRVPDIMAVRETAPQSVSGFGNQTRAFVEVQNGCDHRCTFCIIPYGRGNSRSVPAGLVVDRIKALVDEGYREVVLTGVDVTSYGPDLPGSPTLGMLVERILRHVPALPRLRLSSLDSVEIDDRLFEIVTGEPRFMPHLHMSFQAGDDMILKRMKRRHTRAQAIDMVARLKARRPEIAIGADLIAGFPTETDDMAANSLRLIDECDIVMGHIFPYSPKQGTPAARMPQVAAPAIKVRAKLLREASARRRTMWLSGLIGTRQKVLVEKSGDKGHAENFAEVHLCSREGGNPVVSVELGSRLGSHQSDTLMGSLRGSTERVGKVVEVEITAFENDRLIGEPA